MSIYTVPTERMFGIPTVGVLSSCGQYGLDRSFQSILDTGCEQPLTLVVCVLYRQTVNIPIPFCRPPPPLRLIDCFNCNVWFDTASPFSFLETTSRQHLIRHGQYHFQFAKHRRYGCPTTRKIPQRGLLRCGQHLICMRTSAATRLPKKSIASAPAGLI